MKQKRLHILAVACFFAAAFLNAQNPNNDPSLAAKSLLNPDNHCLVLIDHEGQMAFAVQSHTIEEIRNNTGLVAASSKLFKVPTIVTTVAERSFSGPVFPEIAEYYPDESTYIDRTTMNSWEDTRFKAAVEATGKKRIVMAGLWTEVCILTASLSALEDGYEVYVITDACGGVTKEAHDMAVQRMIQAGVVPITSMQYMLEKYRDWAKPEHYKQVNEIAMRYGGSYGLGIQYIKTMTPWILEDNEVKSDSAGY